MTRLDLMMDQSSEDEPITLYSSSLRKHIDQMNPAARFSLELCMAKIGPDSNYGWQVGEAATGFQADLLKLELASCPMVLSLVEIQRTQWGEANGRSPDRHGVPWSPIKSTSRDARGSEIPGNSAKESAIGLTPLGSPQQE
jgi:hypothetical protein